MFECGRRGRVRKKRRRLIEDLIKRREEVILRAKMIANKDVPESLINTGFADVIKWMITPHIEPTYEPYNQPEDSEVRGFQNTLMKILKAFKK